MPYDDERQRPSWREIDKMRDRSPHTRSRKDETELEKALKDRWMKERYLKEVEKLFAGKKGTKDHDKALARIHKSYGTNRFNKAVRDYVKEYGLPEDWSTLILLLDHRDDKIVCEAMQALKAIYPSKGPLEQQGFISKIKVLSMTAKSAKVQEEAMVLLEELRT